MRKCKCAADKKKMLCVCTKKILQLDADNLAANIFLGNYYYLMAEQEKKKVRNGLQKTSFSH